MKLTGYYKNLLPKVPTKARTMMENRFKKEPNKIIWTVQVMGNWILVY